MVMGRNHVTNRFAGKAFLDRLHHRRGARLIERSFDGDKMVAHLDHDRSMRSAGDFVHAIGELEPLDVRRPAEVLVAHISRHAPQDPLRSDRRGIRRLIADRFGD